MGKPSRTIDAAEGSPLTLEAIMAEHQEAIRRYVERQGFHGADRDDLVQEIFHGAARSLPRFDPHLGTMRAWLLRIAFNLITHERKRAHRRHETLWPEEALDELSSDAPDSETRLIEAQRGEILAELLLSVPPARREILVAHDLEEAAVQDIAEERALPSSTVWNHLRLARLSLGAAARRWRARNRGRGALLAPLAVAFGAGEARAFSVHGRRGPLRHPDRVRRLLARARGALRRSPPRGEARRAARSRRTWPAAPAAMLAALSAGRWAARAAAGAVAGALVLLAPAGGGDLPLPNAHAVALHPPLAARPSLAARPAQHGSAVVPSPEASSKPPGAGAMTRALQTASHDRAMARPPSARPRGDGARSTPEQRLMRQAIATLAAGRAVDARRLLERHQRDFPQGDYAGDREELLRRLRADADRGGHGPGPVARIPPPSR
ncbi:sigma-70 family RNA polymerase sigma factor [Sorangium cellulosum]|uniref:RNA polymerase sigma factor n=1 Tax=Sorangium cellulosum TaxID=56 RepID=UPI003D9A2176